MADQEQKALELMAQAEKKLKGGGGLFGMFGLVVLKLNQFSIIRVFQ